MKNRRLLLTLEVSLTVAEAAIISEHGVAPSFKGQRLRFRRKDGESIIKRIEDCRYEIVDDESPP